jgi:hypothetical protein
MPCSGCTRKINKKKIEIDRNKHIPVFNLKNCLKCKFLVKTPVYKCLKINKRINQIPVDFFCEINKKKEK